jgi:PleD family two-component response regulator
LTPFIQALQQQVERFGLDTGTQANLKKPQNERALPQEIENALLRICQEALTNVKKHARASLVDVNLAGHPFAGEHTNQKGDFMSETGIIRTRILIADDHVVVREGLSAMLSREKDFQMVGEAVNGREAVSIFSRVSRLEHGPIC